MAVPLLTTKLFIPPARPDQVIRESLLGRLDETLRPGIRLGLISAPAGFGKTSLLSTWLARRQPAAAWVSLDAGDNTPGLFLAYLAAAIERAYPGLIHETTALHRAAQSSAEPLPTAALLTSLINELSTLDPNQPLILALDDYQFIHSEEINEAVRFLVENLPPGVRLILATRADPPLPLARLRARRQMVELRAADLRFTEAETQDFLFRVMGLPASTSDAGELAVSLNERTEGWIAGLQMAALALQASPETTAVRFIRSFTGSHRYILDYLAEEVLTRLPEETTAFLLQTSILERFNAALCEAVVDALPGNSVESTRTLQSTGNETPNNASTNQHLHYSSTYQSLLDQLDRANLFLIPLDGERTWFRYHHLFADLLQARLRQSMPGRIPELHRRASTWFEHSGLLAEAIQHALAAGQTSRSSADYERAAELVEKHTLVLLMRGELHALQRWVGLLPETLTSQRPWFNVHRAWVLVFSGLMEPVEALLRQAEASAQARPQEERALLEGHCHAVRTQRAIVTNQIPEVFEQGRLAAEKLPEGAWPRGVAEWAVGYALRMRGDLEPAAEIFERLLRQDQLINDPWGIAMTATDLGVVRRNQGRLRDALAVYQSALEHIEALGARSLGYVGRLLTAFAGLLYELNNLPTARKLLEEAVALNQRWRNPNHLMFAFLNLSRVAAAEGNFTEAYRLLDTIESELRSQPIVATLRVTLQGTRAALALAQGQPPPLHSALEDEVQAELQAAAAPRPYSEVREVRLVLLAKLLLAHRRPGDTLRLLSETETAARAVGRVPALAEMLTLQAMALHSRGQAEEALSKLGEAVNLLEPEQGVRSIIDCAPLLPGVLVDLAVLLKRRRPAASAYLNRLLQALGQPAGGPSAPVKPASTLNHPSPTSLVEPLSERELEVLHLLAEGLTNIQIAARLVISPGTVKAHTANIFRKLDAANRTQAVAIARDLRIL